MTDAATEPRSDRYDGVVIGSGLGGLAAASFLAKAGKKMLVVERLDGPGGYAHSFSRGPYLFDPAVHAIGQAAEGLMVDDWLRALGVRDLVEFIPLDPFYTAFVSDVKLDVPFGVEEFTEAHVACFPEEEAGIRGFMRTCSAVKEEWDMMRPGSSLGELADASDAFPTVLEHRSATLGDVLDRHLVEPRLKALISTLWGYQGAPPGRLGFITFAGMLLSFLECGQSYCRGSFQKLVDAFVTALELNGGELIVGNAVTRVLVDDGRVIGVELEHGGEVIAPLVVSNADATRTFAELVGHEHLSDPYLRRLGKMTTSNSGFLLYAATTLDLESFGHAHEIFVLDSSNPDAVYDDLAAGGDPGYMMITAPSLVDPSLAPPGEHIVTTVALVPYDAGQPWSELKERYTEAILQRLERVFPGFREQLTFCEAATPHALEKYSLNRNGAMYGWENTPFQSHARRLSNMTPIEGLYLAGAWSQPGSGTVAVMMSGVHTAQQILGYKDPGELMRSVAGAH